MEAHDIPVGQTQPVLDATVAGTIRRRRGGLLSQGIANLFDAARGVPMAMTDLQVENSSLREENEKLRRQIAELQHRNQGLQLTLLGLQFGDLEPLPPLTPEDFSEN